MKSELTGLFLTFVLGVLAVAGVIFALQTIFLTSELRKLSAQENFDRNSLALAQTLVNDVALYNQKSPSPELTKLLQAVQTKSAAR
jgi:hypothetical protein